MGTAAQSLERKLDDRLGGLPGVDADRGGAGKHSRLERRVQRQAEARNSAGVQADRQARELVQLGAGRHERAQLVGPGLAELAELAAPLAIQAEAHA